VSKQIRLVEDTVLAVPSHVLSRKAGNEVVLLNLDSEQYFGLDGVGNQLWDLIEDSTTFGQVVNDLLQEYDVDRGNLEADLRSVLTELAGNGLVLIDGP
jgi:hypothetical protein